MTTFTSDILPSAERPKPLTQQEADAITWHADREVQAALRVGVIHEEQSEAHWRSVCEDVVGDQELIDKLVAAHKRFLRGKRTSSKEVVIAHDLEQEPISKPEKTFHVPQESAFSRRHLLTAGATAIGLVAAMRPIATGYAGNTIATSGIVTHSLPLRREEPPELPPHKRGLELVRQRNWSQDEEKRKKKKPGAKEV